MNSPRRRALRAPVAAFATLAAAAALAAPLAGFLFLGAKPAVAVLAVMTAVLFWRHKENIARLRAGTEGKIGGKKKDGPAA